MTIATDIPTSPDLNLSQREQEPSYQIAQAAVLAADDRKGENIVLLAIGEVSSLAEYFVIASGFSKAQVRAIAGATEETIKEKFGRKPRNIAGEQDGSWILLDYGDVIVHAMMAQEREYYDLEAFWGHAPKLEVVLPVAE
ncbi:ribosome silencing factor [Pseudanabaena sp. ABRG5-3]|jgi:ribosome-associated protein|uniref:ribosome silencing factor n=1 Tax=Pseudanabaena sp. ABRG5-3 TaxID=685565 RepID=UPI000DC6F381|nr:ribosome silencing factor [Pseudanabaena sp. ABRG5-3]BBC26058.1 iojap family protein [Pseudanabaena sp. ABRG5-3]